MVSHLGGDVDPSIPEGRPALESVVWEPLQSQVVRGLLVAPADRVVKVGDEGVYEDVLRREFVCPSVRSLVGPFGSFEHVMWRPGGGKSSNRERKDTEYTVRTAESNIKLGREKRPWTEWGR